MAYVVIAAAGKGDNPLVSRPYRTWGWAARLITQIILPLRDSRDRPVYTVTVVEVD